MQRCPHFDPNNWDHKSTTWFSFLKHAKGIPPDKRIADKVETIEHDPTDKEAAFRLANAKRTYFGLFYINPDKPRYDEILLDQAKNSEQKPIKNLLDNYRI